MSPEPFTPAEIATVLAALRYWQANVPESERAAVMPEHFDGAVPLGDDDIDDLCEDIQCGGAR